MQKLPLFWFILIAVLFSAKTMGNKITSIDDIPMELRKAYHQYHSILSELKQKADEQTSEKRAERFMRFHDQYKNAFDSMAKSSKIDMLKILNTANEPASKLKGHQLLDKATEYVILLDQPHSDEMAVILSKYNDLINKYNPSAAMILSELLSTRLSEYQFQLAYADELLAESERELAESERELAEAKEFALNARKRREESEKLLQTLLLLKAESKSKP